MTKKQLEELKTLYDNGCTDSDIEDFCEDNNIEPCEAFLQVDIWDAPECCKECRNVCFYPNGSPCSYCARPPRKDYFEKR